MPRYFFHLHTETGIDQDLNGTEFVSLEAAVADATVARSEYLRDEAIEDDRIRSRCRFEITDHAGHVLATVPRAEM